MAIEELNREIAIAYPNGVGHPIKAQYVQVTKNGKYVLNYLEKRRDNYVPSFTEIFIVNGEWSKSPFHSNYDEYEFLDYDKELSEKIINELPLTMKIRIKLADDRKEPVKVETKNIGINDHGAKEIINNSKNDIFYILFPNEGEDKIDLNSFYPFGLPFPTFAYAGNDKHSDALTDENIGKEVHFTKYGLSLDDRNKVTSFLKALNGTININDIPVLDVINNWTNEKEKIHFVNCSDLDMFGELYKTKNLFIGYEGQENIKTEELLSKSFSNELPLFYETETGEKKNNGFKNKSIIR